jgi:hypothetical protein
MAIYTAPFSAIAVSAAQDLWELLTHTTSRIIIREIRFGQYSDSGDAAAESLGITFRTGDTTSGSGGSTITPVNLSRLSNGLTAVTVVERNNTTQAQTAGVVVWAESWNVMTPFIYKPDPDERFIVPVSTRFVVTVTAPADALTMSGTIVFEEIGLGTPA